MNNSEKTTIDSVILAGGFGTRLSPLTDSLPKPMLPIASESAFLRNLKLLRKCGFKSTAVTTMYLPEKIEAVEFNDGYVEYLREDKPLGSAGAVAQIKNRADDCVLILSGDAFCDYELDKEKEKFIKSGHDAAMILCRTSEVGEYGSVCVSNGRITALCEKPSVRDTLSDLINTGIYFIKRHILDMIPEGKIFDFAKDLFPAMLKSGMSIGGLEPMGHWFDIGSFGEYHRCNMWVSGGESCIGKKTSIHPNARIEHSVIFDNCTIGNSVIRGSIIGEGAVIGNDCIIPSGCVIGPGAELRDGAALAPSSIVQTGLTVIGNSFYDSFSKPKNSLEFDDDHIIGDDNDDGYFVRLGRILGGEGNVIAFAEGSGMTLPHACEIACGASEAGSSCTVISGGNDALASFAAAEYRSKTAFISHNGEYTEIRLFSSSGMPYSREQLRKLSSKNAESKENAGSVFLLPHGALIKRYLFHLKARAFIPKKIKISNETESTLLKECSEELNVSADSSGAEYYVSKNGERAEAILPDGRRVNYWQLLIACCIEGRREFITLPRDTPDSVEQILKRHSITVKFYGDNESEERRLAEYDRLHRDGTLLALTAAGLAERSSSTLGELIDRLPPFSITTRTVYADRDKMASVIARLRESCGNTRCAGFEFGDGRASVIPSASGRFRIIAEATDSETAEEISLRAIDMLEKSK